MLRVSALTDGFVRDGLSMGLSLIGKDHIPFAFVRFPTPRDGNPASPNHESWPPPWSRHDQMLAL